MRDISGNYNFFPAGSALVVSSCGASAGMTPSEHGRGGRRTGVLQYAALRVRLRMRRGIAGKPALLPQLRIHPRKNKMTAAVGVQSLPAEKSDDSVSALLLRRKSGAPSVGRCSWPAGSGARVASSTVPFALVAQEPDDLPGRKVAPVPVGGGHGERSSGILDVG